MGSQWGIRGESEADHTLTPPPSSVAAPVLPVPLVPLREIDAVQAAIAVAIEADALGAAHRNGRERVEAS